jgi:hypothetical protein
VDEFDAGQGTGISSAWRFGLTSARGRERPRLPRWHERDAGCVAVVPVQDPSLGAEPRHHVELPDRSSQHFS